MTQFTIPEGSGDQILGYVRRKAAEWTIPQMIERVEDALGPLFAAARAIPDADLGRTPPGEEWTPLFCIRHVAEINAATASRCAGAATAGDPDASVPPLIPPGREAILETLRGHLDTVFASLRAAEEDAHPDLHWTHPLLGELTWREWLLTLRVHSLAHTGQLEEMRAKLGE